MGIAGAAGTGLNDRVGRVDAPSLHANVEAFCLVFEKIPFRRYGRSLHDLFFGARVVLDAGS